MKYQKLLQVLRTQVEGLEDFIKRALEADYSIRMLPDEYAQALYFRLCLAHAFEYKISNDQVRYRQTVKYSVYRWVIEHMLEYRWEETFEVFLARNNIQLMGEE